MDEQLVLKMVERYANDGMVEYKIFSELFDMLNDQEKDEAEQILENNGIEVMPDVDSIPIEESDLNSKLIDDELFKDSIFKKDINLPVIYRKKIKQSNEILCRLIQQGNKQAELDLCIKNKRLVCKYAYIYMKRYNNLLDFEDLEQVGFIGLLKASKKYKAELGYQFSTYATWWIRQAISREIMDKGHLIRIPVHFFEKLNSIARLELKYLELGVKDRIRKISEETSLSEEKVCYMLSLITNVLSFVSLNAPINDEKKYELIESVEKSDNELIEDSLLKNELVQVVETILVNLSKKEKEVIKLRFGIDDKNADSKTLDYIGKKFNLTRERIRQIEKKILKKLQRRTFKIGNLEDFLD